MSNTVNQLGGKCPYMPFLGGGQMSGGNMSYTRFTYLPFEMNMPGVCFKQYKDGQLIRLYSNT